MTQEITKSPELESRIARLKQLFVNWIESGVEVFLELRAFEIGGEWRSVYETFEDCLRGEFPNALGILQYRHVIDAIDQHGLDKVRQFGVHACHAMTHTRFASEPEKLEEFHAVLDKAVEDNGGVPVDSEKILKIRKGVLSEPARPTREQLALRREQSLSESLKIANQRIRVLQERVRELENENEGLRKKLGKQEKKSA